MAYASRCAWANGPAVGLQQNIRSSDKIVLAKKNLFAASPMRRGKSKCWDIKGGVNAYFRRDRQAAARYAEVAAESEDEVAAILGAATKTFLTNIIEVGYVRGSLAICGVCEGQPWHMWLCV